MTTLAARDPHIGPPSAGDVFSIPDRESRIVAAARHAAFAGPVP